MTVGVTVVLLARNPDPVSTSLALFGVFVHFRSLQGNLKRSMSTGKNPRCVTFRVTCKITLLTGKDDEMIEPESLSSRLCCLLALDSSGSPFLLMERRRSCGAIPEASAESQRGKEAAAGGDSSPTRAPPSRLYPLFPRRRSWACGRDWRAIS